MRNLPNPLVPRENRLGGYFVFARRGRWRRVIVPIVLNEEMPTSLLTCESGHDCPCTMPVDTAVHSASIHKTQHHAFFIAMVFLALGPARQRERDYRATHTTPAMARVA